MNPNKNTVRNDARFGFSWLISLVGQGGSNSPLAFLKINLLSLCYGDNIKFGFIYGFSYRSQPQATLFPLRAWGFFMVKGFRSGLHIYASNKIPSLAIDQSRNSTFENLQQCGHCPKPDNPRPYKADGRRSLERIGCSGGQPNESMLVCAALGGFIGRKGLCKKEKLC